MPIFSRRTLRQRLGLDYIRDTVVAQTTGSHGVVTASTNIIDSSQADPTASGEQLFYRSWMRMLGSAGKIQDLRVGSFNTGSGAFYAAVTLATTIFSGMPFEVHKQLSPSEKDRAIDGAIQGMRYRKRLPINAIVNGHIYSIGPEINDILDARFLSDPDSSLNWGESGVSWTRAENANGQMVLQVWPAAVDASYILVIDAILTPTLGAGDLATVNLLNDEVVMWGAAARCFYMLEQDSPGQETARYKEKRQEAAYQYSRLNVGPFISRKIQLGQ